jgi:hypothetical protein
MTTTQYPFDVWSPYASLPSPERPADAFDTHIIRLRPVNGLLLQAEHLQLTEDYAEGLAGSLAQAGGDGVALGLDLALAGDSLHVARGLAYNSIGRTLRVDADADFDVRPLIDPDKPYQIWIIELAPAEWILGDVEIQRRLCDDPCADVDDRRPYSAQGAQIVVAELDLIDLEPGEALRSRFASFWFEFERLLEKPLSWDSLDWAGGNPIPNGDRVALGVLGRAEDRWWLDVWTARRDRIAAPAEKFWQRKLGMRPRDIYVAQVLQFLAHLADIDGELATATASIRQNGIVEVASFGSLPLLAGDRGNSIRSIVETYFVSDGIPDADLRFCFCRPDHIGSAFEEAQHLDRIRLDPDNPQQIDILVPSEASSDEWTFELLDTEFENGPVPGWVAFVRRSDRRCVRRDSDDDMDSQGEGEHGEVESVASPSTRRSTSSRATRSNRPASGSRSP